jgi:hypothetical protein
LAVYKYWFMKGYRTQIMHVSNARFSRAKFHANIRLNTRKVWPSVENEKRTLYKSMKFSSCNIRRYWKQNAEKKSSRCFYKYEKNIQWCRPRHESVIAQHTNCILAFVYVSQRRHIDLQGESICASILNFPNWYYVNCMF